MAPGPAFLARRGALLALVVALVWIVGLEELFRRDAGEGVYFHEWTSEYMMQAVSAADLRAEPFRSLWYNHIQPPVFDAIRATLARLHPRADGPALLRGVDRGLYRAWALVYAVTALLVFAWLRDLGSPRLGALGAALFLLLPGPVFYAAFLDSTALSALLLLLFVRELWRLSRGSGGWPRVAACGALLFLTRSVFQWPFLLVVIAACALLGIPWRATAKLALAIGAVMALFLLKQYLLFGLTITSSFGPDSFCKGLSQYCRGTTEVELPRITSPRNALALRHTAKLNGEYNYNQLAFLRRSFSQMAEYRALVRRLTLARIAEVLRTNLDFYLRPTSRHSAHLIVDRLPWREPLDAPFSRGPLLALLLVAAAGWAAGAREQGPRAVLAGIGLALPVLYVAAVSIVFESGENMRYRYFVEPVVFVFLVAQLARVAGRVASLARPRQPAA